jgi:hypothetical protein
LATVVQQVAAKVSLKSPMQQYTNIENYIHILNIRRFRYMNVQNAFLTLALQLKGTDRLCVYLIV